AAKAGLAAARRHVGFGSPEDPGPPEQGLRRRILHRELRALVLLQKRQADLEGEKASLLLKRIPSGWTQPDGICPEAEMPKPNRFRSNEPSRFRLTGPRIPESAGRHQDLAARSHILQPVEAFVQFVEAQALAHHAINRQLALPV